MRSRLFLFLISVFALLVSVERSLPQQEGMDPWLQRPVDDATYRTYLDFFAYSKQIGIDLRVSGAADKEGLRTERLSFQSTPGIRVYAALYQPSNPPAGKRQTVIFLHGGTPQGKDEPYVVPIVSLLARAGFSVLAMDMQYFGERSTDLLKTFSELEKHERLYNQPSVYLAWVTQTAKDVRPACDMMMEERSADSDRIALVGVSRGAIAAAIIGAVETRFRGVAMLFGGHFDALEKGHLAAACPANYIGRLAPRRLLMVNATEDSDMIRERSVDPLFKLAQQPKKIVWTKGGHGYMTDEHWKEVIQWLGETLALKRST